MFFARVIVLSLLIGFATVALADQFTFTTINDPNGGGGTTAANGINNAGQILGSPPSFLLKGFWT